MKPETYAETVFEAELAVPSATARLARFSLDWSTDREFRREASYWLDMCLSPRPEELRGCYYERWGPHRFEPLGEIFLLPPGESLRLRTEGSTRQVSIVCEISQEAVQRWLPAEIDWTDQRLAASLDIVDPHIRACLFRLAAEVRRPGAGSEELAIHIVGQLAIEVARFCEAITDGPVIGGLASWRLRLIEERLHRYGSPPSLDELAELCGLSVRQLTRAFRASRGCTVGSHISTTRIELAKRHLDTDESIKEIASLLGYSTPSAFSYAFRRATGSTPRQFRARQLRSRPLGRDRFYDHDRQYRTFG
jgi:AraC family transcriptional regulator